MREINRSEDFGFCNIPEYDVVQKYMNLAKDKNEEIDNDSFLLSKEDKVNAKLEYSVGHINAFRAELDEFYNNYNILNTQVDLNGGIFSTIYFKDSLILSNELNLLEFDKKFDKLIEKDKTRDEEFVAVDHILIRTKNDEVFIIPVHEFRYYLNQSDYLELLKKVWKYSDMYIPRSIWWRSFKTLNKQLFNGN